MSVQPEVFFMPASLGQSASGGQRFCLFHPAQCGGKGNAVRGLVLYIHPFAEEMNKSRRMAALQARALAGAGFDVLQIDLLGCGDSSGDFGDATWQSWVSDVLQACDWLCRRRDAQGASSDLVPLWLWGLRAGCLLAVEASSQMNEACNFLFWQPPTSGKPLLQQFLRLKVAGDALLGQAKGIMEKIRRQLEDGSPVEIAGYLLSSELAKGLEKSLLAPPASKGPAHRLQWFELSTREDTNLGLVSKQTLSQWQQAGYDVSWTVLRGAAFWQTTEIEEAPALIAASTAAVCKFASSTLPEASLL